MFEQDEQQQKQRQVVNTAGASCRKRTSNVLATEQDWEHDTAERVPRYTTCRKDRQRIARPEICGIAMSANEGGRDGEGRE